MKEEWEGEREALSAENDALKQDRKKLEYVGYYLLKVGSDNRDKFKRIRAICDVR
jgi:hypothetical protein